MRNICVLIFLALSSLHAAQSYGQITKFSLEIKQMPLAEIFREIEKQSEFLFNYIDSDIVGIQASIQVKNRDIDEILKQSLKDTDLGYTVNDRHITIYKVIKQGSNQNDPATVSGTVYDVDGEPLLGVNVFVKGTTTGVVTDINGKFSVNISGNQATLTFSFLGYAPLDIRVKPGDNNLIVHMKEDVQLLEEVVVVGYGTMKKSDLTGAVSPIKTEDIEAIPVYNMEQALKGRSAGVQVTQNSGEPGGRIEVRIRGGNSMIGSNDPLYVVDGFPVVGGIDFLNPSDIESMNILKDASATAIYGSRGANGVVIITTRSGIKGQKTRVEVSSLFGIQNVAKRYDLLDAKQYAEIANIWLTDAGSAPYFNINEVQNPGTDWQDYIFRSALMQNHTVTVTGSSENTRFSVSGNYYGQDGIIVNSGVKRGSFRVNLDHDIAKWGKLGVNVNLSRRTKDMVNANNGYLGNSILSGALSAPPTLPVYDEDGLPTRNESVYSFGSNDMRNPMIFARNKDGYIHNTVVGNTTLDIFLSKDLTFKTLIGMEYETYLHETYTPIIYSTDRGYASEGMTYRSSFLNENTLTYIKTFNDRHNLNVVGGYTYQTDMNRYHSIGVSGFANNTTENYNLGAAETINPPSSDISEWTLASFLGRVNYSLDNKYLFTVSLRADGSSRFGANHKWGYFPSGAIAWRVSEEAFMQNIEAVSDFKLRVSYGVTGNTGLNPYQSLDRMSSVKYIYGNQTDVIGFTPSGIANKDLKWEETGQFDAGFDLNFINNRLRFTFDYYLKHTTDLLASVPLPPSIGFGSILQNVGEIKNKGIELGVFADVLTGPFKWDISANISGNRNKVVKLAGGSDIFGSYLGVPFWTNLNVAREGEPFGMFYGYLEDGLDADGYIKYKDLEPDGIINAADRTIIGNPYPDFIYGINTNLSYKNWELNAFFEGVQGNDIFWATAGSHLNSFQRGTNQFADIYGNFWTPENPNPNAKYPRISRNTSVTSSDRFIKDGSYFRLKSLKIGYNLPFRKWGVNFINYAQIYVSGTNLLTLTNYPGLDPEVSSRGTNDANVSDRLRLGIDESAYPSARVYSVGLKVHF
ncbi:MAG: TonB-dependent receptor [Prevotella sp.]|nr:TonB-dependent receptor [Prevotella sp.]